MLKFDSTACCFKRYVCEIIHTHLYCITIQSKFPNSYKEKLFSHNKEMEKILFYLNCHYWSHGKIQLGVFDFYNSRTQ